jgi:hypothetical protein
MLKEAEEEGVDVEAIGDGSFLDPEEEKDYWIQRMSKQAGLDLLTTGTIGMGNLDAIITMDPDDQKEIFKHALGFHNELKGQLEGAERQLLEDQQGSTDKLGWNAEETSNKEAANVSPPQQLEQPSSIPSETGVMNSNLLD